MCIAFCKVESFAIGHPEWPHAFDTLVQQFFEFVGLQIQEPYLGGAFAGIALSPPPFTLAIEQDLFTVGR